MIMTKVGSAKNDQDESIRNYKNGNEQNDTAQMLYNLQDVDTWWKPTIIYFFQQF